MANKKNNKFKHWTKEDEEYLIENIGSKSARDMAKRLGRSLYGIKNKQAQLGVSHRKCVERISLNQLGKIFGTQGHLIKETWVLGQGLPVVYHQCGKRKFAEVDIDAFWKWAEKHKSTPKWERLEENVLGIEPSWVKELRKECVRNPYNHFISNDEKERFVRDVKSFRYTAEEICKIYNITKNTMYSRLKRYGIADRPEGEKRRRYVWDDAMEEKLETLIYTTDLSLKEICKEMDKTVPSVQTKLLQMYGRTSLKYARSQK